MRLGVLVKDLGPGQLAYALIKRLNATLASGELEDAVVFYEDLARPCLECRFATMQLAEGWGHDGVLVATTLSTARKLAKFPSAKRTYFYCWDLEWVRMERKSYEELRCTYCDSSLTLLARGTEHAELISSCWGRPVGLCHDFDLVAFRG